MKKAAAVSLTLASILVITGLSFEEVREYTVVLKNRLTQSLKGAIPISVELDRVDLLLSDIDSRSEDQKQRVAGAQVALEEAEALLRQTERRRDRMLTSLRQVRKGETNTSATNRVCSLAGSSKSSSYELGFCLNACRQLDAECEARSEVVNKHKTAVDTLHNRFTKLQSERKLLAHRLSALRARFEVQRLSTTSELSGAEVDALARVTELADNIDRQLKISEAAEKLEEEGGITAEIDGRKLTELESEVDEFLSKREAT